MGQSNPFKFGSVVMGEFFYDRKEELLRIKQTLAGGNNITLYAPRRYGKSSLVKKALTEFDMEGFTTVYLDFMSVYSRETFIKNYTSTIAAKQSSTLENAVKKVAKFISGVVPSVAFDPTGMPSFSLSWIEGKDKEQTLIDVINLPEKLANKNHKWIIAFDEFQEITKLNGENFEKLLRSAIQHHQNVSYLFLGSKTHILKDMFNNKNRAFYNAASVMGLETIDESESKDYLVSRFNMSAMEIGIETSSYLLKRVENIPYYIQFIAFEIWQTAMITKTGEITNTHVDEAVENILNLKSDYYWELTNRQTGNRKKVLFALSCGVKELFSKQTAKEYYLGAVSSTQKAIEVLINEGIIERKNSNFFFSDPIYKEFIRRVL